jgi:hypothetical protein
LHKRIKGTVWERKSAGVGKEKDGVLRGKWIAVFYTHI